MSDDRTLDNLDMRIEELERELSEARAVVEAAVALSKHSGSMDIHKYYYALYEAVRAHQEQNDG